MNSAKVTDEMFSIPARVDRMIPISCPSISQLEIDCVRRAVESSWVSSLGEYLEKFEEEFAAFCETRYAISVSNGTTALHLALVAIGVGAGDEVIVPNLSFIASVNAILYTGATPIFADIDPVSLCLDPEDFRKKISARTRAVMPVHLYGHPADMQLITAIAEEHEIAVVEDAAEAHGARAYGRRVGSWGMCGAFSFYGNKIITTGEGGMITTNHRDLNMKVRHLRDHAMSKTRRYWHDTIGFNYRMTNLQAALGYAQLQRVEDFIGRRQRIFQLYKEHLSGISGISLNRSHVWAQPVNWLVCMELDGELINRRDELMESLKKLNVDTRPYFYPMSQMPFINKKTDTPVTIEKSTAGINLPTYYDLKDEEIQYVCNCIKALV